MTVVVIVSSAATATVLRLRNMPQLLLLLQNEIRNETP